MNPIEEKAVIKIKELIKKNAEVLMKKSKLILERYYLIKKVIEDIDIKIMELEKDRKCYQGRIWELSKRCEDIDPQKLIDKITKSYVKAGGILRD